MALREILLQQLLLLGAIILAASEPYSICNRTCGSLHIPYPFGTSEGCYLNSSFLITCKDSTPFLRLSNEVKVLDVSLEGEIRVSSFIARDCPNEPRYNASNSNYQFPLLKYFLISYTKNKFFAVGCDTIAVLNGTLAEAESYVAGCLSLCDSFYSVFDGSCEGIGCCQTSMQKEMRSFFVNTRAGILLNHSAEGKFNHCSFTFVAEEKAYNFSSLDLVNLQNRQTVPVVLDWAVGNETCRDAKKNSTTYACKAANSECYNSTNGPGYLCKCPSGYEGNPYDVFDGCKGNDKYTICFFFFLLFFFSHLAELTGLDFHLHKHIYIYMTKLVVLLLLCVSDINECEENPNPCNKICENIPGSFCNKICENIPGSFNCSCPKGYEGDGTTCRPKVSQFRRIAIELGKYIYIES
jgi:hypothetical protein